ncbi:hypothetical protein BDR03DRAFT_545777 [Suillus americanus]|nr:hypothetical protein BDR03DRAFT_545777 [Suillus americanus]
MDDTSLLQMAKAWPLLEELSIIGYSNSNHQVTPHSFVLLLWHCPCLVSVAVSINWIMIDMHAMPRDIPYPEFSHNALSHLVLVGSRIENPVSVAAFMSAIAPNIKSIGEDNEYSDVDNIFTQEYSARMMFQDLVTALPIIREQGMRMMFRRAMRGSHSHRGSAQRGG